MFHVLRHVPTADPVTGTPIDPRFTGRDITTIVASFRDRDAALARVALENQSKPVYVKMFSLSEGSI